MPDLSPAARKALAYWPQIEEAARDGMTTQDLWSLLQDTAEEMGLSGPGVSAAGVSELRGIATSIQRSEQRFARADADLSIEHTMITEPPWARALPSQNALGIFQVRYQHTYLIDGEQQTDWRTSIFRGQLPGTVGDLRAAITEDASMLSNKYGVDHVDFDNVQILAV